MVMLEFKIKTLDGRTHEFTSDENSTIAELKQEILQRLNIAVDQQRLLYRGRSLEDHQVLSTLNIAGYTMHLVTRPPPQMRSNVADVPSPVIDEPNSDHNREQIRNIINDLLSNIGDYSNLGQVSVNNEGNRMDITVNIPSHNRLSLARLRYNYQQRLLNQSRAVLSNLLDPNEAMPLSDHERLQQTNPYDVGENDERLIELTTDPLPVRYLADMVDDVLSIWNDTEPALRQWQRVLRRDPDSVTMPTLEQQRIHDTSSRLIHLLSHMLHIMSDYLVEFHDSSNPTAEGRTRSAAPMNAASSEPTLNQAPVMTDMATSANLNDEVPLTTGCGESAAIPQDISSENQSRDSSDARNPQTNATTNDVPGTNASGTNVTANERSRYLYVYSEVPAQVVQVRLDVDSDPSDLRSIAQHLRHPVMPIRRHMHAANHATPANNTGTTANSANPRSSSVGSQTRNRQFASGQTNTILTPSTATAPSNEYRQRPYVTTSGMTDTATTMGPGLLSAYGRTHARSINESSLTGSSANRLENMLDSFPIIPNNFSTIPLLRGSGIHPLSHHQFHHHDINGTPQSISNVVDPYCRCHSRHFQHPSRSFNGGTNAPFGAFRAATNISGTATIPRRNVAVSTNANTTTEGVNRSQRTRMTIPPQTRRQNIAPEQSDGPSFVPPNINAIQSLLSTMIGQAFTGATNGIRSEVGAGSSPNIRIRHSVPSILNILVGQNTARNLHIIPSIMDLFMGCVDYPSIRLLMGGMVRGSRPNNPYPRFNSVRLPLQNLLMDHQQQHCENHSREELISHLVDDLHALNRQFYGAVESVRNNDGSVVISDVLRNHINRDINIERTSRHLIETHVRSIVDIVMRSPTDTGFGELIGSSLSNFFQETIVLMATLCNEHRELIIGLCTSFFPPFNFTESRTGGEPVLTNISTGNPDVQVFVSTQTTSSLNEMINLYLIRPHNFEELKANLVSNHFVYLTSNNESGATSTTNASVQPDAQAACVPIVDQTDVTENTPLGPASSDIDGAISMLTDNGAGIVNSLENDADMQPNGEWNDELVNSVMEQDQNTTPITRNTTDPNDVDTPPRFSDTYLSGMPPKRRRVAESNQNQEPSQPTLNQNEEPPLPAVPTETVSPNSILLQITRRAVGETTDQPEAEVDLPPIDSQQQTQLESTFRQMLTQTVQPNDPDGTI